MTETLISLCLGLSLGIVLSLLSTVAFDVVHVLLHKWSASRWSLLRWLGSLHEVHHAFLDRELRIHDYLIQANVMCHVIPEYLVQVSVTLVLGTLLQFPGLAIVVAICLETLVFALIMKPTPGFDVNHRHVDRLQAYCPLYFCLPEYHLLHHVYPDAYFGSWLKTLDHLLATGTSLTGRKAAMSGSETAIGQSLRQGLLQSRPVVDTSEAGTPGLQLCRGTLGWAYHPAQSAVPAKVSRTQFQQRQARLSVPRPML